MPSWYRDPSAPTPNNPRAIGAVALIVRDETLLLDRRSDDGSWGLPGGRLDEDEDVTEAVTREVREETGLVTRSTALFGVFSDPTRIVAYPDGNVYRLLTVVFRVEVAEGDVVASDESLELRYVPFAELQSVSLLAAHRPIIDAFLSRPTEVIVA